MVVTNLDCREFNLDPRAFKYIREVLKAGQSLSQAIDQALNIEAGTVSTYFPLNIDSSALHEFTWGGKLTVPPETIKHFTDKSGKRFMINPQQNTLTYFVKVMHAYLENEPNRCYVLEEGTWEPSDPCMQGRKERYFLVEQEIYYLLKPKDDAETVHSVLDGVWQTYPPLLAVASIDPISQLRQVDGYLVGDKALLTQLAENVSMIFVGAYDAESLLVWKPSSRPA